MGGSPENINGGMSNPNNRFTGRYDLNTLTVIICSALALYNSLELMLLIFTAFHAYRGLYFWSLVLANFGVMAYMVGFLMEYFRLWYMAPSIAIDTIGWALMVTGQSVVLYSRLYLLFGPTHRRLLQSVKWMIIVNGVVFHSTVSIVVFGSHFSTEYLGFGAAYNNIERTQMVAFCTQEFILSGLYIWKALDIMKVSERKRSHRLMYQLLAMNIIVVMLDIALLSLEFRSLHVLQQTFKGLAYSAKLKLELVVLNKLVELSGSSPNNRANTVQFGDTNEFLDPTKTVWDITRFAPGFSTAPPKSPRWMSDLEKTGMQHPKPDSAWIRQNDNDHFPDAIQPASTIPDSRLDAREKGSATDLLYADAVRGMANPG